MGFKKIKYSPGERIAKLEIVEIGGQTERWKVSLDDFPKLSSIIKRKFGLFNTDKDLDWALK